MMGRRESRQGQLFYSFDLDKAVPADHLVRQIDGVLDLEWVHKELAPYFAPGGRCNQSATGKFITELATGSLLREKGLESILTSR